MKHTEYYNLMKEAAKAELLSNAVKAEVPGFYIQAMITGEKPEFLSELKAEEEDTGFHAEYEQITGAVVSIFEAWQKENGVESAATSLHRLIDTLEQNRIDELRTIAENQEEHREQMKAAFREIEETMNAMAKMPPILYDNCGDFREFVDNFVQNIKQFFQNLWNGIVSIFQGVGQWFIDRFTEAYNGVTGVFAAIGQWFGARWQDIKNALATVASWFLTMFTNAYTNVKNVFSAIGSWFGARWTEIKTALSAVPSWFGTQFQNAWTNIKNAFANVTSFFSGLWEKIKGCFVNVGVKIGSAVGDAFKSAINSCLSTIEGVVNKFIGMINGVIDVINEIPGVSLGKIGTLSLPRLAKGGVLKEGTAMVAEAGPELLSMVNGKAVVTPLSGSAKNQAMENAGKGGGGYVQNVNITSPKALSPYEIARQTRLQTRSMILAVQRG